MSWGHLVKNASRSWLLSGTLVKALVKKYRDGPLLRDTPVKRSWPSMLSNKDALIKLLWGTPKQHTWRATFKLASQVVPQIMSQTCQLVKPKIIQNCWIWTVSCLFSMLFIFHVFEAVSYANLLCSTCKSQLLVQITDPVSAIAVAKDKKMLAAIPKPLLRRSA